MKSPLQAALQAASQVPLLSGNLQRPSHLRAWKAITRSRWVLKTIRFGLKISIVRPPYQVREPRHMSWRNPSPMQKEWMDLAKQWNTMEKVPTNSLSNHQIIHNLISEPKKGRLCSNTRLLNRAVKKMPMKMESIKDVRHRFRKGTWLLKIDLSKFYWTLRINPAHRQYFRFRIDDVLMQWRCLPFGFVNSMQIMARIMAPVVRELAKMGIETIMWVDDMILLLSADEVHSTILAAKAVNLLTSLGFIINQIKTSSKVSMSAEFRGFMWDLQNFQVFAPEEKRAGIIEAARNISPTNTTPRLVATLIGRVRYVAQIHYFALAWIVELEFFKNSHLKKGSWDIRAPLHPEAILELSHWLDCPVFPPVPIQLHPSTSVMGDAGPLGYGVTGLHPVVGLWSVQDQARSTNWRELQTWAIQIRQYSKHLTNKISFYGTDSIVAKSYMTKVYGKTIELARLAAKTVKFMEMHNIIQIPRLLNQKEIEEADLMSRLRLKDDLSLSPRMFQTICNNLKFYPTIDLFASRFSKKIPRFCTIVQDPKATWVNAFHKSWTGEQSYAFPPKVLIPRVLAKVKNDRCRLLLIYPILPFEIWSHDLRNMAVKSMIFPANEIVHPQGFPITPLHWKASVILGNVGKTAWIKEH